MQPGSRRNWEAKYIDGGRLTTAWREAQVMRKAHRPMGRIFCLLMGVAAYLAVAMGTMAAQQTNGPALTQVVDTVYRADGAAAMGTVLISWPGFTTADGKAVAAGSLSVRLGSGGAFAASLAPNTGAQPAGVYYKVVYQLADDTVQPAWAGEYSIASDCLAANDVLPGDAVQVATASRHANFAAIVREVDVQLTSLARDRSEYAIRFANDAAQLLGAEFSQATLPDPLPIAFTTTGPSSLLYLPDLTAAQVTDVIDTEITIDAGTAPPTGGGIEVRRTDGGWGATSDGNLVGRYTSRSIELPRLSRIQEYLLRQYDGSSPTKYSRRSALVHVDYPY